MGKYTENYRIKSFHANKYGKASLTSLLNFMIEAAWGHAQILDWGYDKLQANNLFWVLSRMYIEVERYPEWQEEIVVKTWPAGTDGMFAYRNYSIETVDGELILQASSCWLILDLKTKKIFLLREYRDTFPKLDNPDHCRIPKRIKPPVHPKEMNFSPVLFSELDVNKHFNSVNYLERVLNDFGTDFLDENEPVNIELNYLKEGLQGDSLAVVHQQVNDQESLSGSVRESDRLNLFAMNIIKWKKRTSDR